MENAAISPRRPEHRFAGLAYALSCLLFVLALEGCEPREHADLMSTETFVEYCMVVIRAQEKAQGDPEGIRRLLALEPLPDGWDQRMIAFAEGRSLRAREWADLLAEAHARVGQPAEP